MTETSTATSPKTEGRFISLRVKLLIGFTLLFTLVFAAAYYWFYTFSTQVALNQISEDLVNTLEGAEAGIDTEAFLELVAEGEPNEEGLSDDPRYEQHMDWLDQVHQLEPRAWPYTYVRGDDDLEVAFIGDIWLRYDDKRAAVFKEEYVSEGPLYYSLDEFILDTAPYEDDWGNWISAWQPITDENGESVGGIGVDFRAEYVFEVQQRIRSQVVVAFAITYGVLFILVFAVSQAFTRPIIRLTEVAERIGEGDYEQDLSEQTKARLPDEIVKLAAVFETMVGKVATRENTLRREVEELRIMVDEGKRKKQVEEIVDSEFFQDLRTRAQAMRERARRGEDVDTESEEKTEAAESEDS